MTTKDDLLFVREYEYLKRQRERELDRIREAVGVHSPAFDKIMVTGGPERDRMAEHAVRVDEAVKKFNDAIIADRDRYLRICDDIYRLPPREMEIIRLRYQDGHSWKWIRRNLHYEKSQAYRIHARALRLLAEMQG